ncbi:MAG: hypothetical protein WC876_00580 [Candidatus Thermoplasmatota archaeon]|jgi:hypothetical protein
MDQPSKPEKAFLAFVKVASLTNLRRRRLVTLILGGLVLAGGLSLVTFELATEGWPLDRAYVGMLGALFAALSFIALVYTNLTFAQGAAEHHQRKSQP